MPGTVFTRLESDKDKSKYLSYITRVSNINKGYLPFIHNSIIAIWNCIDRYADTSELYVTTNVGGNPFGRVCGFTSKKTKKQYYIKYDGETKMINVQVSISRHRPILISFNDKTLNYLELKKLFRTL